MCSDRELTPAHCYIPVYFVAVGEVRVIEYDEDLKDDTVIGADRVALAGNFDCGW